MAGLHELTAAQATQAYASGELSPVEVTRAVLTQIDAWEPHINAIYRLHRDAALAAATASRARWKAGKPWSAIDGVPITIKENIFTAGDPAPIGTAAGSLEPKTTDAPAAARVRESGAVLLGKTTMPDFGMLSSGLSSVHGTTRNPWRLDRNPAGSSSGAGAAAAAGYGPLHIGTDIGGSIRLPATHCGVFGIKPSLGRVPVDPPYLGRVAGPITRTVHDAALLLQVLAGPDSRDFMSLPYQACDYAGQLDGLAVRGLRIGVIGDMGAGLPVDPQVTAVFDSAVQALSRAGAIIEPLAPFYTPQMLDGVQRFFEARSYNDLVVLPAEIRAKILPFIVQWCTWRAASFTGADVMTAYGQIHASREATVQALGEFDFVMSPVSPVPPYSADIAAPGNDPHNALAHIAFTVPYNLSEQPAASLSWGYSADGLPIGVQVIGQRFDDLGVLRLCRALEQLRGAQRPWPSLPAA